MCRPPNLDPQSGVFHAITVGSVALNLGFLGVLAAILVTVGNAGGVGSTVAGIARVPFVVGIDRYLPAAFGKIHPRWKTPYISILVQAVVSGVILLLSQINETTRGAYQFLIDAAIILYFIPFLYMFAAVIKLAHRKDRAANPNPLSGALAGGRCERARHARARVPRHAARPSAYPGISTPKWARTRGATSTMLTFASGPGAEIPTVRSGTSLSPATSEPCEPPPT